MSRLKKEQYEYRNRSAEKRQSDNEELLIDSGFTQEQAALISDVCRLRHTMHININNLVNGEDSTIERELIMLNHKLFESGVPHMDFIPINEEDFIDIDNFNTLYEIGDVPEDETERDEWYQDNYERIYGEWEELNHRIENYLLDIDKKYNTRYCPTGFLRAL